MKSTQSEVCILRKGGKKSGIDRISPWVQHQYELINRLDMLDFDAELYLAMMRNVALFQSVSENTEPQLVLCREDLKKVELCCNERADQHNQPTIAPDHKPNIIVACNGHPRCAAYNVDSNPASTDNDNLNE